MIRKALYKVLNEDAKLKELAPGGVHHRDAGPDGVPPLVIFFKSAGTSIWTMDGDPLERGVWVVKGVGTASQAEAIDKRCREILNLATLPVEGQTNQDVRAMNDVNYGEYPEGRDRVDHIGAEYKIDSEDE
jgi:hypothetical protein